jgi:ribosomal protein S18 acetylase RimI-like enzyme
LNIIPADPSHVDRLAILNKRLIEDERHPNPMDVAQLAERMSAWLQSEYTAYLFLQDGEIAAYCLYRDDGDHYFLRQLFVDRGFRRRGIATHLLDWMYKHIWSDKKVRLEVLAHNKDAIAFYQEYGFRVGCLSMEK